jgi:hypothetical protein
MKFTEKQFAYASVISVVALLCIWVIPNTIALRHLLLILGCLSAIGLIRLNWSTLRSVDLSYLPLFSMLGLLVWVLIHYIFFSLNPELELSEIRGLWMRSLLGAISAIGLAIAVLKYPNLRLYFFIALFMTPAINVIAYTRASYLNHGLLSPPDFYRFLFTKIETAYFGTIAAAVAVGNLISLTTGTINKSKLWQISCWMMGLVLVLISAVLASTKNGVVIALGLCLLLVAIVLINALLHKGGSRKVSIILALSMLFMSAGIWESHKSSAYRGWDTVLQDAALGIDIDGNQQWQKSEGTVPLPLNNLGLPAATNTYTRFAYATVGIRLFKKFPLGYGSINQSFNGLQEEARIPHEHEGQVHSGWIDFGLAFGIPGLLLVFTSLFATAYLGIQAKSIITIPWAIVCLTLIPFGLIAEISYKQYFEATLFFIVFAATIVALIPKFNSNQLAQSR